MLSMTRELFRRLGVGESIDAICQSNGWKRVEFDAWWQKESVSRPPRGSGQLATRVKGQVAIHRDRFGIPHIFAESAHDLWFAFGFAMAQDRLFQMDYLRRKSLGRLAEVLGQDGVQHD